ncbi:hypothetical protein NEF87_001539 [Candidatus Lokiarchaeum ossiferum]|uniref:Uncharacterized protein n=1 Tax=Candidatus Lokiarchaeum ossiferum TaxID=2951803 RepID=A0ABY6HS08_9ARCH|nr:hypothetical protein NEF87_001539 [Candidatus Lokiarchaeum sp. B-35]
MSEGLTIDQLQNPAWEAIFDQQIFMPQDLMEINIQTPNELSVKEQVASRTGKIEQKDWKYFNQSNKQLKTLQKRYPYLY